MQVFHAATALCSDIMWETPHKMDRLCCERLSHYYGPDSPLPSRNCFCAPQVWTPFAELAAVSYVSFTTVFDHCS